MDNFMESAFDKMLSSAKSANEERVKQYDVPINDWCPENVTLWVSGVALEEAYADKDIVRLFNDTGISNKDCKWPITAESTVYDGLESFGAGDVVNIKVVKEYSKWYSRDYKEFSSIVNNVLKTHNDDYLWKFAWYSWDGLWHKPSLKKAKAAWDKVQIDPRKSCYYAQVRINQLHEWQADTERQSALLVFPYMHTSDIAAYGTCLSDGNEWQNRVISYVTSLREEAQMNIKKELKTELLNMYVRCLCKVKDAKGALLLCAFMRFIIKREPKCDRYLLGEFRNLLASLDTGNPIFLNTNYPYVLRLFNMYGNVPFNIHGFLEFDDKTKHVAESAILNNRNINTSEININSKLLALFRKNGWDMKFLQPEYLGNIKNIIDILETRGMSVSDYIFPDTTRREMYYIMHFKLKKLNVLKYAEKFVPWYEIIFDKTLEMFGFKSVAIENAETPEHKRLLFECIFNKQMKESDCIGKSYEELKEFRRTYLNLTDEDILSDYSMFEKYELMDLSDEDRLNVLKALCMLYTPKDIDLEPVALPYIAEKARYYYTNAMNGNTSNNAIADYRFERPWFYEVLTLLTLRGFIKFDEGYPFELLDNLSLISLHELYYYCNKYKDLPLPDRFKVLKLILTNKSMATAENIKQIDEEIIRNTDMVFDLMEYVFEEVKFGPDQKTLSEQMSTYKQKFSDVCAKIGISW